MPKNSIIGKLRIKKRSTELVVPLRQRVFALAVEGETVDALIGRAVGHGLGSPRQVRSAVYGLIEKSDEEHVYLRGT